jgi:hypothetical protein
MINLYTDEHYKILMLHNLLKENGIVSFIENQIMSTLAPWIVNSGGYMNSTLKVNESDFEKSKKIIDVYNNNNL